MNSLTTSVPKVLLVSGSITWVSP